MLHHLVRRRGGQARHGLGTQGRPLLLRCGGDGGLDLLVAHRRFRQTRLFRQIGFGGPQQPAKIGALHRHRQRRDGDRDLEHLVQKQIAHRPRLVAAVFKQAEALGKAGGDPVPIGHRQEHHGLAAKEGLDAFKQVGYGAGIAAIQIVEHDQHRARAFRHQHVE